MKTILDKINRVSEFQNKKVELTKHEVELTLADDIKMITQKGEFAFEDLNDSLTKYIAIKKQFDENFKKSNDSHDKVKRFIELAQKWDAQATPIYTNVLKSSKELGIEKNQINGVTELEKMLGNIGKLRGDAQRILAEH
jgi:poly(A) polymerase Pap1